MKLPDPVPVDDEILRAIASRHGVAYDRTEPLPGGIINSIYGLGPGHVLRIPRDHPAHVAQAMAEAAAIPAAAAAGVRTPGLVAFDDRCDLLPVPYLLVERVRGVPAEALDLDPARLAGAWREVGRDLARLHQAAEVPATLPRADEFGDPRALLETRVADGWLSSFEARWLAPWLDDLALAAPPAPGSGVFVHGDVQMSNVLVDPASGAYVALIDWGCASRDDPACDFRPMPLATIPHVLAGYREVVAPALDVDEARILWRRLQLALAILPRGAAPGCSWGERPVAWLVDLLHFFADPPTGRWRQLAPPR